MLSLASSIAPLQTPLTLFTIPSKPHHKSLSRLYFKPLDSTAKSSSRRLLFTNQRLARASSNSGGLYSAQTFELTVENVDLVLEDVRPYLISDGGNVDVVSVDAGVISLQLQGACESCPSSTATMKMGIERVLKEKFGDAVKEIRQVFDEQPTATSVEAVNRHLDILRPAIKNFGGSVEVISVTCSECLVNYTGPESIGFRWEIEGQKKKEKQMITVRNIRKLESEACKIVSAYG